MYHGFGERLKELLTGARLLGATGIVDALKADRSSGDIEAIRQAAANSLKHADGLRSEARRIPRCESA